MERGSIRARACAAALGLIVPGVAAAHYYAASLILPLNFASMGVVAVVCFLWRTSAASRATAFLLGVLACGVAWEVHSRCANVASLGFLGAFAIGTAPPLVASSAYLLWSKRLER